MSDMKIILFRGRPGAGKTTVSNELAKKTSAPILRKDDIYDVAAQYVLEHQIRNKVSYGALYAILESNIGTDCVFILDYPFQSSEDVAIIENWCKERAIELKSIVVTCTDEELWAKRFNVRADNPLPNQLITNFEDLKKHYGTMQIIPQEDELLVDTVEPTSVVLEKVLDFIQK